LNILRQTRLFPELVFEIYLLRFLISFKIKKGRTKRIRVFERGENLLQNGTQHFSIRSSQTRVNWFQTNV